MFKCLTLEKRNTIKRNIYVIWIVPLFVCFLVCFCLLSINPPNPYICLPHNFIYLFIYNCISLFIYICIRWFIFFSHFALISLSLSLSFSLSLSLSIYYCDISLICHFMNFISSFYIFIYWSIHMCSDQLLIFFPCLVYYMN